MSLQNSNQLEAQDHLSKAIKSIQEYEISYLRKDLDAGIRHARASVNAFADGNENRAGALAVLGVALQRKYQAAQAKDLNDVEEAVQVIRQALELKISGAHRDDPQDYFENLERCLMFQYTTSEIDDHIRKAADFFDEIVMLTREGSPYRALALKGLCGICSFGYLKTGLSIYLDRGKVAAHAAIFIIPDGHPLKATILGVLHDFYDDGFKKTNEISQLDGMIQVSKDLLDSTTTNPLMVLHNLATAFTNRYGITGDAADIEQAIASRASAAKIAISEDSSITPADRLAALRLASEEGRDKFLFQKDVLIFHLRNTLRTYFERAETIPEIDEVVLDALHITTMFMPDGHQQPIEWQSKLGDAFQKRYEQSNRLVDIEYAILCAMAAMQLTNADKKGWEQLEDKYRARYRLWSEHTGKMPKNEIALLFFGGDSYIPPEMDRSLELFVPYCYYLGDLPTD